MRFTGEWFEMGHLMGVSAEGWRVRLDDGREVGALVGNAAGLYKFIASERVCVSFAPGREAELTGFLTLR